MKSLLSIKECISPIGAFVVGDTKGQPKFPDGNYEAKDVLDAMDNDFESESELCDYIETNIERFCLEVLGFELKSFVREYPLINGVTRAKKGNRRIDFYIVSKDGQSIGLECKHPKYASEHSSAVGQALTYIALFEQMEKRLDRIIIVSTKIDQTLPLVIDRFKLPIGFIAFDKSKHLTFIGYGSA